MSSTRPRRRGRYAVALLLTAVLVVSTSGCSILNRNPTTPGGKEAVREQSFGPCWPIYGNDVLSVSMSGDGESVLYISPDRPEGVAAENWGRDARALYVLDNPTEGSPTARAIAVTWPPKDEIPPYATADSSSRAPSSIAIPENIEDAKLAESGGRFIVAVSRAGVFGRYAKLYTGVLPPEGAEWLEPENGLTFLQMNDYQGTEGIISYDLSPDGSKVAASVGAQGEIRIYDLNTSQLTVYDRTDTGATVVRHDLPPAETSISAQRRPAVSSTGTTYLRWSPAGDRLAIGMTVSVATTGLVILDVATGEVTPVRRFSDSTVPQVDWAADGQSLFVMSTKLSAPQIFGNTEIRRLAAEEDGREVSPGGQLPRPPGFRGEPGALVSFGDDEHFVFVWETALWRLNMPAGDPSHASYVQLTPPQMRVHYERASVSLDRELVAFVAADDLGTYVGQRTFAMDDQCPLYPSEAEEQPTTTEEQLAATEAPAGASEQPPPATEAAATAEQPAAPTEAPGAQGQPAGQATAEAPAMATSGPEETISAQPLATVEPTVESTEPDVSATATPGG